MPKKSAKKKKDPQVLFLSFLALVLLLFLTTANITSYFKGLALKNTTVLGVQTSQEVQLEYWKNFLNDSPAYLPGWVELAKLEKELGNLDEYKEALNQAKKINPNSELLEEFN